MKKSNGEKGEKLAHKNKWSWSKARSGFYK